MSTAAMNAVVSHDTSTAATTGSSVAVRIPSAQPRLRLTRRGRAVFTGLAAVPVVIGVMFVALNGGGATATSSSGELELVTLQAGQSLWQLAEQIAPENDPRDVISDILAVNELDSGSVQAGQRIALPVKYSAE